MCVLYVLQSSLGKIFGENPGIWEILQFFYTFKLITCIKIVINFGAGKTLVTFQCGIFEQFLRDKKLYLYLGRIFGIIVWVRIFF